MLSYQHWKKQISRQQKHFGGKKQQLKRNKIGSKSKMNISSQSLKKSTFSINQLERLAEIKINRMNKNRQFVQSCISMMFQICDIQRKEMSGMLVKQVSLELLLKWLVMNRSHNKYLQKKYCQKCQKEKWRQLSNKAKIDYFFVCSINIVF